ncbi:hypothetical protein HMPREF1548_04078 [Clostridium sp. KLE 1755]|nr:hypothetical protein HMPREF1548_04078 [Clostridium sp. KLE 1755]
MYTVFSFHHRKPGTRFRWRLIFAERIWCNSIISSGYQKVCITQLT